MKCEACSGLGYREYEAGLIQVGCEVCNGTGEVVDDSSSRTGQPDSILGSNNTSQPKRTYKSKKKQKATKKSG